MGKELVKQEGRKTGAKAGRAASPSQFVSSQPSISNLTECQEDARLAVMDAESGPEDPTNYSDLLMRLDASRQKLPPLYRETVANPYVKTLKEIGDSGFAEILAVDPQRERGAGLMLDIAHAIIQNGEDYNARETDALQEVVSDLYDGFLSAEDRRGVNPPDQGMIPPLVKWGNHDFGPYTWPVDATASFGVQAAIVSLPPAYAP